MQRHDIHVLSILLNKVQCNTTSGTFVQKYVNSYEK